MSQQALGRSVSVGDAAVVIGRSVSVGDAAVVIARVLEAPPRTAALEALHAMAWPMRDAESLRGAALLAESRLAGERPEHLAADFERLFVGGPGRPPIAEVTAPVAAEPGLRRLLAEPAGTGLPADGPGLGLPGALRALAAAGSAGQGPPDTGHRRQELLDEHLLTWGARCLTRVQLGARTFCYQGVAALGLGLLRLAGAAR